MANILPSLAAFNRLAYYYWRTNRFNSLVNTINMLYNEADRAAGPIYWRWPMP